MTPPHESIFRSAIRKFCHSLAAMTGIAIGVFLLIFLLISMGKPSQLEDKTTLVIVPDAHGQRQLLSESSPVILRINIHGRIGTQALNQKTIEAQLLDSREGVLKGDRIKGIFLHIQSPGGAVTDSYAIYTQLKAYKEKYQVPIYAFVNGICASGAMMIACAADHILSTMLSNIGSVGVILGPNFNVSGLMEKYGVTQLTVTGGKNKDSFSPFRPWKPGEEKYIQDIVSYNYEVFVDLLLQARPRIERDELINNYGAKVFYAKKAQEFGYIDNSNSSYDHALSELVKHVGIEGDEPYQVFELQVTRPILSDLMKGKSFLFSGNINHKFDLLPDFQPEFIGQPLYLYSPTLATLTNE